MLDMRLSMVKMMQKLERSIIGELFFVSQLNFNIVSL